MPNRFSRALVALFEKAPKPRGGKTVVNEQPITVVSAGASAGEPLPLYPLIRYPSGKPASRSFDFPANINLSAKTDQFRNATYRVLRWFADNLLVARAAINVRRKEIVGLNWEITDKDEKRPASDAVKARVKEFWESPDRRDDFGQWLNKLLEDIFVVDAPAIEVRRNLKGEFYGLDILDGTTIKILLDNSGRIPLDGPAYQQIIKGQAVCDFSVEELIYNPYNNSSPSPYGKSFLETALLESNVVIRALTTILGFFTGGKVPTGFIIAPESLKGAQQFLEFQQTLSEILAQNSKDEIELMALPFGSEYQPAKEINFADFTELKHYLNTEILMAFEVQPQEVGLTYDVNRSTGEQQENITYRRAIKPICEYLEKMFYRVNKTLLGAPEVEFKFTGLEAEDRVALATVHQVYSQERVMTVNEIRKEIGLDPVAGGDEFPEPIAPPTDGLFAYDWADVEKELDKWQRKILNGNGFEFKSEIIPPEIMAEVNELLADQKQETTHLPAIFAAVKKKLQTNAFGRRSTGLSKKTSPLSPRHSAGFTGNGGKASLPRWANPYRHLKRTAS